MGSATKKNRTFWVSVIGLVVLNSFVWSFAIAGLTSSYDEELGTFAPRRNIWKTTEAPPLPAQFIGSGERKTRLLYQDYQNIHGFAYQPRSQVGPSCVGNATACAIDILGAVNNARLPPSSAAWLYGSSRVLGDMAPWTAGSHVRLAVQAANEVGFIFEDNYFLLGVDLTVPNEYERLWANGTPALLDPLAENYVTHYFHLLDYEDVRDAIHAGMPVVVGSQVGFGRPSNVLHRDRDGFLNEPFFRFRGKYWFHAMTYIAHSSEGREGILCQNSWGASWVGGPQKYGDEPAGSFWIDPVTVNKMVRAGDCYAIHGLLEGR